MSQYRSLIYKYNDGFKLHVGNCNMVAYVVGRRDHAIMGIVAAGWYEPDERGAEQGEHFVRAFHLKHTTNYDLPDVPAVVNRLMEEKMARGWVRDDMDVHNILTAFLSDWISNLVNHRISTAYKLRTIKTKEAFAI